MKVLVADDDRVHVHMLSAMLRKRGVEVIAAYDALQAWMAVVRTLPDAVILDIQMPGGSGYEVLRKLRSSAKTGAVPVVVLSGSIDARQVRTVLDLGADEVLLKPVDLAQLYRVLTGLLGIPEEPNPAAHRDSRP